jgi:hypothetical protein
MNEEFEHVSNILKECLSDEPQLLIGQLSDIEAWNSRMQFLLAEWNSILSQESLSKLPESGTELERKTVQKAMISQTQEQRDKLDAICDAIKTRITLGQSFLKYYSTTQNIQFKDNQAKDNTKSLKEILGENQ